MRRALPLMIVAGLIGCAPAGAQEAIATASNAPPLAPSNLAAPLALGRHQGFSDEGAPIIGPCGAVGDVHDGVAEKPDKNPHGSISAGVGTHGYRDVGGAVCVPLGDHAAVSIAFDAGRFDGGRFGR
jgi:hypothetical protein